MRREGTGGQTLRDERATWQELERSARTCLEARRETPYTDAEWQNVRRNLQAFTVLVLGWGQKETNGDEALVSLAIPPDLG